MCMHTSRWNWLHLNALQKHVFCYNEGVMFEVIDKCVSGRGLELQRAIYTLRDHSVWPREAEEGIVRKKLWTRMLGCRKFYSMSVFNVQEGYYLVGSSHIYTLDGKETGDYPEVITFRKKMEGFLYCFRECL